MQGVQSSPQKMIEIREYSSTTISEEFDEDEELMVDDIDEEMEEEIDEDMEASDSASSVVSGSPHGSSSNHSPSLQVESPSSRGSESSATISANPEKRHICDICGKGFSYFSILESHKRSHTGEKPFNCHFCDKKFAQKATLQVHERTHTGERPYKCRYCEKTFAQYGTKTVHEKSAHLGIRNYKCPKCDKSLSSPSALYTHKKTHGDKTFRCEFCPKTFALKNYLKLHVKQVHEQNERKHVCPYCNKGFAYAGSLQVHVRTHTGERPYTCRYCPKAFASQGNLQSHERTHTGERPYSCQFCQRTFIQKSQLTAHESTHSTGNKNPLNADLSFEPSTAGIVEQAGNFECTFCHKKYPYASSLYVHMRKHASEKAMQFNCTGCAQGFGQQINLTVHMERCEAYKNVVHVGNSSTMSSNCSNDDSDSDGETKVFANITPSFAANSHASRNIYQQQSSLGLVPICNLSEIKLPLGAQQIHHQTPINFGLAISQPQAIFQPNLATHTSANVQTPFTPKLEITDFGPLTASKPPQIQNEIQSCESLSAFHAPVAKSTLNVQSDPLLANLLSSNQTSLPTTLLSTQLLLQQLQNTDQLNYLIQQNILSLAAAAGVSIPAAPAIPQFVLPPPPSAGNLLPQTTSQIAARSSLV